MLFQRCLAIFKIKNAITYILDNCIKKSAGNRTRTYTPCGTRS